MLKVTRRTREVDIILNQQIAEDIARLGDTLAEETTRERVTEAGTNRQAKATARRIEELREQADAETLKLTLRALPVSKWAQALAAHRNENGTNDMFGTAAAALPLMLDSATIGGTPVADEDKTEQAWRNLFDELTDGQFTPIWQAIAELNGTAADPKAAFDLASKVLRNLSRTYGSAASSASATSGSWAGGRAGAMRSNGMRRSVIGCARWRNTNARCAHYAVCRARSAKTRRPNLHCMPKPASAGPPRTCSRP